MKTIWNWLVCRQPTTRKQVIAPTNQTLKVGNVEIRFPGNGLKPMVGYGVKVFLDGVEQKDLISAVLELKPKSLVTLTCVHAVRGQESE